MLGLLQQLVFANLKFLLSIRLILLTSRCFASTMSNFGCGVLGTDPGYTSRRQDTRDHNGSCLPRDLQHTEIQEGSRFSLARLGNTSKEMRCVESLLVVYVCACLC